jgi:hypothetical protein
MLAVKYAVWRSSGRQLESKINSAVPGAMPANEMAGVVSTVV